MALRPHAGVHGRNPTAAKSRIANATPPWPPSTNPGRRKKSTNFALKSRPEMDLALPSRDRGLDGDRDLV
jgi:hypothetical protein